MDDQLTVSWFDSGLEQDRGEGQAEAGLAMIEATTGTLAIRPMGVLTSGVAFVPPAIEVVGNRARDGQHGAIGERTDKHAIHEPRIGQAAAGGGKRPHLDPVAGWSGGSDLGGKAEAR